MLYINAHIVYLSMVFFNLLYYLNCWIRTELVPWCSRIIFCTFPSLIFFYFFFVIHWTIWPFSTWTEFSYTCEMLRMFSLKLSWLLCWFRTWNAWMSPLRKKLMVFTIHWVSTLFWCECYVDDICMYALFRKRCHLLSTIILNFFVDFYNFYTIGKRNEYSTITCNLLI